MPQTGRVPSPDFGKQEAFGHFHPLTPASSNPLISILNTHRLDEIENHRLQCLRTRIMAYNFTAQWLKGANNQAADALSHHPHSPLNQGDDLAEYEIDTKNGQAITSQALSIAQLRLSRLNQEEHGELAFERTSKTC